MPIQRWLVGRPAVEPIKGCVIAFPGRYFRGGSMEAVVQHMDLYRSMWIVLEPHNLEWYPMPNGASDQDAALAGLEETHQCIKAELARIQQHWQLQAKDIALIGFSAGAVVALHTAIHACERYAGVVSFAGAILDPDSVPPDSNKTPILLQHNQDDGCFDWDERYVPMRTVLTEQGYRVRVSESVCGGHLLSSEDANLAGRFLRRVFGYSEKIIP